MIFKIPIKKIDLYLAKSFVLTFLKICIAFSFLILFINFFEVSNLLEDKNSSFILLFEMAFLLVPDFLNNIVSSLILISAIVTVFIFSAKSEITIIRSSGFSLWNFIRPISVAAFILGVFWVMIFGPISIYMLNGYNSLEQKYVKNENYKVIEPKTGIWLKQANLENQGEELIISAKNVYKEKLQFNKVNIWFFDKNGQFYKKLNGERMTLQNDGSWSLENVILNDANNINKKLDNTKIMTSLDKTFVMQKIVTNFQNEKLFSIYQLPALIKDLKSSGFLPTKFEVYFHGLITKPFLFVAMTLIACYFGLHSIRSNNAIFLLFCGIGLGLVLYITSAIINAFGASGFIPVFAATWTITIICLAVGVILIYKKENI